MPEVIGFKSDTELISSQMEPSYRTRKNPKKLWLIIGGLILITVLLIIIIVVVVTSKSKEKHWINLPCDQPVSTSCPAGFDQTNPPLILVSLDGFKAQYLYDFKKFTPTLQKIRECGVHVSHMRASYPTKTFPNHYTIVTGMFPAHHGIIDNVMLDEKIGAPFYLSSPVSKDPRWWGGEPLWNTLNNNGKLSGTMFWPGSEVKINGSYPTYWRKYDHKFPFEERIKVVLEWLEKPLSERPSFISLYFNEPDSTGHSFGTEGEKIEASLLNVDKQIGLLMDGLLERGLHDCVNLIIVADHGMKNMPCEDVILLKNRINMTDMFVRTGSLGWINNELYQTKDVKIARNKNPQNVSDLLTQLQCSDCSSCDFKNAKSVLKSNLPNRYHYSNNDRIGAIVMDLDEGYQVKKFSTGACGSRGGHGYDNAFPSMWALFLGHGPNFTQGIEMEPFMNIELYNLMADLIGVKPSLNDGTQGSLYRLLRNPPSLERELTYESQTCLFPPSSTAVKNRLVMTSCTCDLWPDSTKDAKLEEFSNELNISKVTEKEFIDKHLPFGSPRLISNENTCILPQKNFIIGYSNDYKTTLWTGYKIEKPASSPSSTKKCLHPDVRLDPTDTASCQDYTSTNGVEPGQLFIREAGGNSDEDIFDIYSLANTIPMQNISLWTDIVKSMTPYQKVSQKLYIFTGPIFDYNSDGLRDDYKDIKTFMSNKKTPVATQLFIVLYRCPNNVDCNEAKNWESMAIIINNFKPQSTPCFQDTAAYLKYNLARVRDVELLTGLEFFPEMEQLQGIRMRTFIQDNLWPGME